MLYLLRTFGRGSRTSLKVGFTDDIVNRRSSYYHSNPFYELLSIREGDEYAEKVLHLYLTARGFRDGFLEEWFLDESEVQSIFHYSISRLEYVIWRNRERLFEVQDFRVSRRYGKVINKPLKMRIYEKLRDRFGCRIKLGIDTGYDIIQSKESIKALRV